MTEEEWLTCSDPMAMLKASRSRLRHRKCRLFAVACCRCIWPLLPDERSKRAIEVAEQFADGLATDDELQQAGKAAKAALRDAFTDKTKTGACVEEAVAYVTEPMGFHAAREVSWMIPMYGDGAEYPVQTNLLREIFGNPFRPVNIDPSWRTLSVIRLAQTIYDNRAFNRMTELGDALERAGCLDEAVLAHCRQPGEHVRGCWVVDLVLGKE